VESPPAGSRAGTTWLLGPLFVALAWSVGCASYDARKQLQGVAKNWCETIRASQVVPVYPLTEDVTPGDVFLVQRPIATEAKAYAARGFLALDDRRTRLKDIDYSRVYFDGYWAWATNYGNTPHAVVRRDGAGPLTVPTNGPPPTIAPMATMPAPRAAFPTYSFQAQSGGGLSLAIPIHGVPVALNYLQSDRVSGSVTIGDASTYAADEQQLYAALQQWAQEDDVQRVLDETVRGAGKQPVYLRVVTRVYLSGGVLVAMSRAESRGAQAKGGFSPPNVSVVDDQGDVRSNYTQLLNTLSSTASPSSTVWPVLTNAALAAGSGPQNLFAAGGTVQFVAASGSSVAMRETFDRPLVIGYLGFDVPVYRGGVLGSPVPTFQRLNRTLADAPPPTQVGPLTAEQSRLLISLAALEALVNQDPQASLKVMAGTVRRLSDKRFTEVAQQCENALKGPADQLPGLARAAYQKLDPAAKDYVSVGGSTGLNYQRFDAAFTRAYDERDKE
jgi:hypothetical protein